MGEVLVSLSPMIIGSALVPLQIIIVTVILTGAKQAPLKATLFVLGMTLVRLGQGLLFGFVLNSGGSSESSEGSGLIRSTLLLVLGLLLLITAFKTFRKEPDPDAPPPKWLTMLETATPWATFLMGAGLVLIGAKLWVFTLGALSTIRAAGLDQTDAIIAFLLYVLLAQSLLIIPITFRLLFSTRAADTLGTVGDWLETKNNTIVMVVSLVFGLLFVYQGVTGLLA